MLRRRPVRLAGPLRLIGKEANRLDDVQAGIVGDLGDVVTEYEAPETGWLHAYVLPVLDRYSGRELARLAGTDRRSIDRIRGGQAPRAELRAALVELALGQARDDFGRARELPENPPIESTKGSHGLIIAWRQRFSLR